MLDLLTHIILLPLDLPSSWIDAAPLFLLAFLIGACLGSFVQAAALRLNRDEDIIRQPSRCRSCGQKLSWLQNMPILGWLSSFGKCRHCGASFSIAYMFVEILMGLLIAVIFTFYPINIAIALTLAMILITICALTDLDRMLLHLPVMIALGVIGFLLSFMPIWPLSPLSSLLGMIAVVILISLINTIYMVWRGEAGFGSGDYWLLGAVGLWLGPVLAIILFFLSAFLGALIGIILMMRKKGTGQTALPFGVFISLVFICWPILNILVIF